MKKGIILSLALTFLFCQNVYPFWIWTPKEKKLISPKYTTNDTPSEQFKWAMKFYEEKDYKRAAEEFTALVINFRDSLVAPDAQYYVGRSYEAMGKRYY